MNKANEDRTSMFYALSQVLDKHATVWQPLLPFKSAHDEFKSNLGSIEDATQRQEVSLKGVALDKRFKKDAMVKLAAQLAQPVFAYAEDKGDVVMRDQVNYSQSRLLQSRDAVVAQVCQNIHDLGNANIADLAAYGVLPADVQKLQAAIDAYIATVGSPRALLTIRKGATAEIEALVKDTMKVLNNRMDKLMSTFEKSDPSFHQEYFDARMIVNSATEPKKKTEQAKAA